MTGCPIARYTAPENSDAPQARLLKWPTPACPTPRSSVVGPSYPGSQHAPVHEPTAPCDLIIAGTKGRGTMVFRDTRVIRPAADLTHAEFGTRDRKPQRLHDRWCGHQCFDMVRTHPSGHHAIVQVGSHTRPTTNRPLDQVEHRALRQSAGDGLGSAWLSAQTKHGRGGTIGGHWYRIGATPKEATSASLHNTHFRVFSGYRQRERPPNSGAVP